MKQIYLFPGHLTCSRDPALITTVLGSCVAVALFDSSLSIGGLNHYLLPSPLQNETSSNRYGSVAIPELIRQLLSLGCLQRNLAAKVFGGGIVLENVSLGENIGKLNIDLAIQMLDDYGIPILEKNVGGLKGRRIALTTNTFEVFHEFLGENRP